MPRTQPDPDTVAPFVAWDTFSASFRRTWAQHEHVSLIGPTGQGKTTLALHLLPIRQWSIIIATKPRDKTLAPLTRRGYPAGRYRRIERWKDVNRADRRILLWPRWKPDKADQARAIHEAFESIYAQGGWSILADDLAYLCRELGLKDDLMNLWQMGRALNVSLIGATQRPAWVPRDIYSAASHLFFWRTNDDQDLRSIGGMNGVSSATVRQLVANLQKHHVLYVDTRHGTMARTIPPPQR